MSVRDRRRLVRDQPTYREPPLPPLPPQPPRRVAPPAMVAPRAPISSEEDVNRLFNVCKTGRGNAALLHETLIFAKPEELGGELIQEFRTRCAASQDLILSQIAWATAEAERSRRVARDPAATTEERLLEELLATNEELISTQNMYEDLERVLVEREALEQSRFEQLTQAPAAGFTPTEQEIALTDQIFSRGDPQHLGVVNTPAAVRIFSGSGLPHTVLGQIWDLASDGTNDGLDRKGIGISLRLIGHAQKGTPLTEALLNEPGPLAYLDGLTASADANDLPPLTETDKAKFLRVFWGSSPENGMMSGLQARDILLKSKLPAATLSQIWDLADARHRGYLDQGDFAIAMYLVQALMDGKLTKVPTSLPPSIYETSGATPPRNVSAQSTPGPSSIPALDVSPQVTSSRSRSRSPSQPWVISSAQRVQSDKIFDTLDPKQTGYAAGDVVGSFLFQSGLAVNALERIWDLADMGKRGYLSKDEFAIAMYLVNAKKNGQELPTSLPPSLIPSASQIEAVSKPQPVEDLLMDLSGLDFSSPSSSKLVPSPPEQARTPVGGQASTSNLSLQIDTSLADPSSRRPLSIHLSTPVSSSVVQGPSSAPGSAFRTPPSSPPLAGSSAWISSAQGSRAARSKSFRMEIPPSDRIRFDGFFDTLDPWRKGYIESDVAAPFFAKSKLSSEAMAEIWDLADMDANGHLNRHEFAVAMHLIREALRGEQIPQTLPPSLRDAAPARPHGSTSPEPPRLPPRPPEGEGRQEDGEARNETPPPPYEAMPPE